MPRLERGRRRSTKKRARKAASSAPTARSPSPGCVTATGLPLASVVKNRLADATRRHRHRRRNRPRPCEPADRGRFYDLGDRLADAWRRDVKVFALEVADREAILRVLEHGPAEFAELRAVLLEEHVWRQGEGLA